MPYLVILEEEPRKVFLELDKTLKEQIAKKLKQLERDDLQSRHFKHGVPVFVEEVSQYRIVFKKIEEGKQKRVVFIGDHKEYEKWYRTS